MRQLAFRLFINNFICNFFLRLFGFEEKVYHNKNPYLVFEPKTIKSTQENAGYSNRPEINEVIEKSKSDLQQIVSKFCTNGSKILDIGCGPGLYLKLFNNQHYVLTATDINLAMLDEARKNVPNAMLVHGNFMNLIFNKQFNFIYCIGVLIYIPRQSIENFFKKIYDMLESDGVLYLNYPHAISWFDTVYNDLTYIQYSPMEIERWIAPYFKIIKHEHAFDGRRIEKYDTAPYKSLNPHTHRTYKNSYLLIAQKK